MKFSAVTRSFTFTSLLLGSAAAFAAPKTFVVGKSGTSPQIATVESATAVETFTGKASSVKGSFKFDPKTKSGSGSVTIGVKSIDTALPLRNEHLQSKDWLDSAKYPNITFTTTAVKFLTKDTYSVSGTFSMHGISHVITTSVSVKYMQAGPKTAKAGFKGDVIQVSTNFPVRLADYGIVIKGPAMGKVAETVKISLTVYATTA